MSDPYNFVKMNQVHNSPAAAFQFNLPSCGGGHNEYLAIVIPQSSHSSVIPPAQIGEICCHHKQQQQQQLHQYELQQSKFHCVNCENNGNENALKHADNIANNSYQQNNDLKNNMPSSRIRSDEMHQNRWCTEYQGTIDECGKKVMQSDERYCRSPIYPKQQFNNPSTFNYNITETRNDRSLITPTVPNYRSLKTTEKPKQPLKKDNYQNINTLNSRLQMEASCSGQSGSTGYRPMSRCFPKPSNMHMPLPNKPVITMHESPSIEYHTRKKE